MPHMHMPHLGIKLGKKKNTIKEPTEERTPVNDDGEDPIMEDREDATEEKNASPSEERYASGDMREGDVLSIQTDKNEDALSTVEEQPSKEEADVEPAPVSHVSDKDTDTHSMAGESITLDKSNTNLNEGTGICTSPVAFCGGLCFSG